MKYKVVYNSIQHYYLEVEANSIEEAKEIAENTDGGEFIEDGTGDWEYDKVTDVNGEKLSKWADIFTNSDRTETAIIGYEFPAPDDSSAVIAVVIHSTKEIEYYDNDAKTDVYAQEVIKEVINNIDNM